MSKHNKYQAKYVYWDTEKCCVVNPIDVEIYRCQGKLRLPKRVVRFDSQHEFRVYLELVRMYGSERVLRQYPVEIISPCWCYPKGKTWKVDFAITNIPDNFCNMMFVEAKGKITVEFCFILTLCEIHQTDVFDWLHLIFPRSIPAENRVIKSLLNSPWSSSMLTLKDFKQLNELR